MAGSRPQLRGRGLALAGLLLAGCYTLTPVGTPEPVAGMRLAFDINDAGRVALGGAMGPEIAQVEGTLIEKTGGEYLLSVRAVRLLRGGEQPWSGEQVRLKQEHVGNMYERKFSAGRSIAAGVIGIGGFTAILATRSLLGLGSSEGKDPPPDSANTRLGRLP
ncbi:MAG: hypothetical protein AB7L66_16120 [Gemmatimonadales bacterium]